VRIRQLSNHIVCIVCLFIQLSVHAQHESVSKRIVVSDTSIICYITPLVCKGVIIERFINEDTVNQFEKTPYTFINSFQKIKTPLLSIHGNLLYDFNYRSYVDTPFALKNIQQHYIQSNFQAIYAGKYPVDVVLRMRQANHIYLRNYFDVNVFFNGETFQTLAKRKALDFIDANFGRHELERAKSDLTSQVSRTHQLNEWLQNPQIVSKYLEYKTYLNKIPETVDEITPAQIQLPELNFNTLGSRLGRLQTTGQAAERIVNGDINEDELKSFVQQYEGKLEQYNCLKQKAEEARLTYEKTRTDVDKNIAEAKNAVHSASSGDALRKISSKYGIKADSLKKSFRLLEGIKSFGIGRSFVDYSELTVKNVSINGVHAVYSSKNYYAFAAGTVDYRFRDFLFNTKQQGPQYVALVRYGKVSSLGNQLILTTYKGRKYAHFLSDSLSPFSNVFGISLETKIRVGRSAYITGEIAKSSLAAKEVTSTGNKPVFDLKDNTTTAVFASFYSYIRPTGTKIRAQYRYQGANFQSFTLYFNQNNSVAWNIIADQSLFKHRLNIQAGVRKNEFTNPFATYQYSSNVVFKTFLASLRLKKLPFLTVAYMPSSQLSVVGGQVTESRFYTFTATGSHSFKAGKLYATSLAMYSRFYNSGHDSGFVYYNAKNIHLNQSFTNGRLISNSTVTIMMSEYDDLYTYEQGVNVSRPVFSFGAGLKYVDLNHVQKKMGVYGNSTIALKKFQADINLSFEHGYLPGSNHNLVANDMGRILIIKRF
jgi:hypothetical protein